MKYFYRLVGANNDENNITDIIFIYIDIYLYWYYHIIIYNYKGISDKK